MIKILNALNSPWLALLVLSGFMLLAYYALHAKPVNANDFISQKLANYEKEKEAWQKKQAMDIYNLTESDLKKEVILWK